MLVQLFCWLALLLLMCKHACGQELMGDRRRKKETACEGKSVSLSCDSGFINVIDANYGRTDRRTCSEGKPRDQISNTHCSEPTSLEIMTTRCAGKRRCTVPATNSVFTDPCFGTYKYLTVTYDCRPWKQAIVCEGDRSSLDCGRKVIVIQHANYGRRNLLSCPHRRATSADCYSDQTNSLRSRCEGKRSCRLNASNSVYGDPCPGVHKYLEVTYTCERDSHND